MSPADPGPHVSLERMNRFQEPEARRIIGELGLPAGSRGLDVGCGVGLYALWLAEAVGPGGRVVAIEPEAAKVEAARALVGGDAAGERLEFQPGDGTAIPLPDRERGLGVVRGRAAPHRGHREGLAGVRPGGPAGRPHHRQGVAGLLGHVPARPPGARATHPARRDPPHAGRGRGALLPGAAADHARVAPRGRPRERGDAHLHAGAPRAAGAGRSRLHPAHRLLAQLGRSTAGAADAGGLAGARPGSATRARRPTCCEAPTTTASTPSRSSRPAGPPDARYFCPARSAPCSARRGRARAGRAPTARDSPSGPTRPA